MERFFPYTIRPMEQADIPAVMAIDRLSFSFPWPASSYLYEIKQNTRSFYYVLLKPPVSQACMGAGQGWRVWRSGKTEGRGESRVIGYVGLRVEERHTHISTLAVHPDWRGRGLGEALLLTALEQTLNLRLDRVTLEVRVSNYVAQRLYIKYGFRIVSIYKSYYLDGEDAWLMQAEIGTPEGRAQLAELGRALEERLRLQAVSIGQDTDPAV